MDGISEWVGHAMDLMVGRWSKKLLDMAKNIANDMAKKTLYSYDKNLKRSLKAHGFTVDLQLTPYMKEVLQVEIAENVALIRSIGNQYLEKVQTHVWDSVLSGMDAHQLSQNLQHDFGVATRRANNIARDQLSKAHSSIERARRLEIGIDEAIWRHSGAGKKPRQSHKKANGHRYSIEKGMCIDGEWIHPGTKINCRCGSQSVLPWDKQGIIELKQIKVA